MWFGKLVLISYLFAGSLTIVAFLMFRFFSVELFDSASLTETSIRTLIGTNNVSVAPNTTFIFGDAINTIQAFAAILFQSITGGVIGEAIQAIPFINADVSFVYIFQFVFTLSQVCLVIAWLANRDA